MGTSYEGYSSCGKGSEKPHGGRLMDGSIRGGEHLEKI